MLDVQRQVGAQIAKERLGRIPVGDVLCVDDTMRLSATTRGLQRCLWEIERQSQGYGIRLNDGKCEIGDEQKAAASFPPAPAGGTGRGMVLGVRLEHEGGREHRDGGSYAGLHCHVKDSVQHPWSAISPPQPGP